MDSFESEEGDKETENSVSIIETEVEVVEVEEPQESTPVQTLPVNGCAGRWIVVFGTLDGVSLF